MLARAWGLCSRARRLTYRERERGRGMEPNRCVDFVMLRHFHFLVMIAPRVKGSCCADRANCAARGHSAEQLVRRQVRCSAACHLVLALGFALFFIGLGHLMTASTRLLVKLQQQQNTGEHRAACHRFSWSLCRTCCWSSGCGALCSVIARLMTVVCLAAF
jgi:hypothetical protein